MALAAQIQLSILAHETSSGDISRTLRATPANYALALTDGTGANQAQVVWSDSRTIATGAYEDLDLTALPDDRGVVSFSSVSVLYIKNNSPADYILIGGEWDNSAEPQHPWGFALRRGAGGGSYILRGGACVFVSQPADDKMPVFSTDKRLRISANEGAVGAYDIVLIGEGTVT
jgi:hypothetical protein